MWEAALIKKESTGVCGEVLRIVVRIVIVVVAVSGGGSGGSG